MNSFQKTVYGLILVLFISIIVSSALYAPEYKVVDIAELELRLNTDKQEYFIGDSINCSVYLVNNYPYKVRTLPQDKVIFYQQPKDFKGSIHPQIKYVDSNLIELESNESLFMTSFMIGPQLQNGSFLIDVHYNSLRVFTKIDVLKEFTVSSGAVVGLFDADGRFIQIINSEFLAMNETALFKIFNNSTIEGRRSNVGWRIEQNIGGQWFTVLEPEPYVMGVVWVFPVGGSFTRSISLVGLEAGFYRFLETVRLSDLEIIAISHFNIT